MLKRSQESLSDPRKPMVSIIVATRNRARSLRDLLASLEQLHAPPVSYEIVAVDNESCDETPRVLSEWAERQGSRRVLRVERPGKSRALNAGVAAARGELLVFLDDDVAVDPDYLLELWDYFSRNDCAAAQGAILWPAEAAPGTEVGALIERYRTIPGIDLPSECKRTTLIGASIVVRHEVLTQVGGFNENLGPGVTGFCDDDELAERILAHGGWIGYMPGARVTHEIDESRLTEEYSKECRRMRALSRFVWKRPNAWRILADLIKAGLTFVICSLGIGACAKHRAKRRWHHYVELLALTLKQRVEHQLQQ